MPPLEDLSDAVADVYTGTYTVNRPGAQTVTKGRTTTAAPTSFTISAGVFPVQGRELERLPEGMREKEIRQIFSVVELKDRDVVTAEGSGWEVDRVEPWAGSGNFYRSLMTKVGT